jgi:putative two-component system protein, hydrogenase maturation factor HypX/HoxX
MRQEDRRIDWQRDDTATVLARIRAADGHPGVLDEIAGLPVYLYGVWPEGELRGAPGEVVATRHGAICRATRDGAVWITHLREKTEQGTALKLPATHVLGERLTGVPEAPLGLFEAPAGETWQEIQYREAAGVGYLAFDFHNGAMSSEQCRRLQQACQRARQRAPRVLVLLGGRDFWSNGIHLTRIEAGANAADASWDNIEAMNDLTRTLIEIDDRLVVAALRGNAGAGGVFLALAADRVWAARGVVLNPHYKNMGNLYGSEYWTYLLPRRMGEAAAQAVMGDRLPVGASEAVSLCLVDDAFGEGVAAFEEQVCARAEALAAAPDLSALIAAKRARRRADEAEKPLTLYRAEEMERMRLNFYGFDPSYHVARSNFVHRVPHSRTPLHLARHRGRRRSAGAGA